MTEFIQHRGIAAALLRANIDTDAIIPSREMKRVSKEGLADGFFANWRYTDLESRTPDPDFVLNRPGFCDATILLALENFGCGSSREFAVWALAEFGIRVVIAPSFGAIFQKNCIQNGVLTAVATETAVRAMAAWVEADPVAHQLLIDLDRSSIAWNDTETSFAIARSDRQKLRSGRNPIEQSLANLEAITEFEARHFKANPWLLL